MPTDRRLRVAILHPDLGLGGAERLILDAALELQARGHRVTVFAGHHDPDRAFEETVDGTLDVRTVGRGIPLHVAARLRIAAALAKSAACVWSTLRDRDRPDVVLCDVVPHLIPLLRVVRPRLPVVFYCHYPDPLLAGPRHGWYRWYRWPFDALDAMGTRQATAVLVNSAYTAGVFGRVYPGVRPPQVVHPGVDATRWVPTAAPASGRHTIVSVARFERSKNAELALAAFARLRGASTSAAALRLVLAGGFDPRLSECVSTLEHLRRRADVLGISDAVDFEPSPTTSRLRQLVAEALAVVHTPPQEHFGFAPVEAMACGRPVVAAAGGGPCETVIHNQTGYLVEPTPEAFADALRQIVDDPEAADRLGQHGRAHVDAHFTRRAFGDRLEAAVVAAVRRHRQ